MKAAFPFFPILPFFGRGGGLPFFGRGGASRFFPLRGTLRFFSLRGTLRLFLLHLALHFFSFLPKRGQPALVFAPQHPRPMPQGEQFRLIQRIFEVAADEGREGREQRHAVAVRRDQIIREERRQQQDAVGADAARRHDEGEAHQRQGARKIRHGVGGDARKRHDDDGGRRDQPRLDGGVAQHQRPDDREGEGDVFGHAYARLDEHFQHQQQKEQLQPRREGDAAHPARDGHQ